VDDEIGTGEVFDEAEAGGWRRRRRDRRRAEGCDPGFDPVAGDCAAWACCDAIAVFDGACLAGLITLIGATGGLLAAVAGTGRIGRRLRHGSHAPHGLLAAAPHRGVRYYQLRLSARRPGHGGCRYTPTCSAYAAESLRRHGAVKGTRLAARRLRRCRPGAAGGVDLAP
jgi:putative membrane protein insertion efficiency factor